MRVAFDVTPLRQTRAGTARYLNGLLPHLERRDDLDVVRVAGPAHGALADVAWYPLALPTTTRRLRVDVLHCPTFRAPLRASTPLVVTVHDLSPFRFPRALPTWSRLYSRATVRRVVRTAARVIAVSEFTRRELVEVLGVRDAKIRVVPHGVGAAFAPAGRAAAGEYVLSVGTLEPRKNLARLVEAAGRVGLPLRVVGARGWGGVAVEGDRVTWLGEVSDNELAALYRGALCVVYPSLYEGFGLPVAEAMASGAAVVTSAGTATAELADGAAVLVDPHDVAAIAAGIERAIAERDQLAQRGLERARRFSWDDAAARTVDVYREVA